MHFSPINSDNLYKSINFKGKVPNIDDIAVSKRFVNCALSDLEINLLNSIKKNHPELIKNINGIEYITEDTPLRKVTSSLKCFFSMPMDIVDFVAKKFPNSRLNNAQFLQKYRASMQTEENIRALQGLQKNGAVFAKEYMNSKGLTDYPTGDCTDYCKSICDPVTNNFIEQTSASMADKVAKYDTKKERFWARIASGFTAALFLGNDFYNKAIQKGKTEDEAKKEQRLKQGQEIKENICEAITQFAVFACFSKTVNKSAWAPAIIGAGIGLASRIISRLSSGMKITRMNVSDKPKSTTPSFKEYIDSAKQNNINELLDNKHKEQIEEIKNKHKKPMLSAKNIVLFCLASIAGGYALRFGKNHTKIGKNIAQQLQKHKDKLQPKIIEEIYAEPDKLKKMSGIFFQNGNEKFATNIGSLANKTKNEGKIFLGTDYKTKKLFGKIEVKVKDLKALKTAPFRFIKEVISYPYKIVNRLEEAIKNSKILKSEGEIPQKPKLTKDVYGIKDLYKRFLEFEQKYGNDDNKLAKEFGEYVDKMILKSNNEITSSKSDNSKIAVMAQTLGTLTGMWFNMNDEFNASIRDGSTKKEAQKDARLRGINKFFRMTVQVIISGSLNGIFQKQYNNSVAKSALIVMASTVLTDTVSRFLSGMPSKKMGKEELEKYQKDHKEGFMNRYYKMIDKLAS